MQFWGTLGTLGVSLLANILTGKGINRAGYGNKENGIIRADYKSKSNFNSASF